MFVELWTALLLGLAGSLHCVGMCGPIALALPRGTGTKAGFFVGRLVYNLGRTLTYSLLGAICGVVGRTIVMSGYQNILSISMGVLILMAVLLPRRITGKLTGHVKLLDHLKTVWNRLTRQGTPPALFAIGILNGLLPCGLVYIALAGSLITGSASAGAAYMALFGLGTLPVMLATALVGSMVGLKLKQRLRQLLPVGAVLLAALFILRGLSLGIPYVSPRIEVNQQGKTSVECCHDRPASESSTGP